MSAGKGGDDALALALATGAQVAEAAKAAGVSERTATRRRADPAFRAEVDRLRGEILSRACGRMAARLVAAGDVLEALLDSEDERVSLRAAVSIFGLALDLKQAVDDSRRLDDLERRLGLAPGGQRPEQPGVDQPRPGR